MREGDIVVGEGEVKNYWWGKRCVALLRKESGLGRGGRSSSE